MDIRTPCVGSLRRTPYRQIDTIRSIARKVQSSLVPALESVSRELSLEVQRTFDYFASTAESERIGKIVLSGGCAKLAGIESFLASSWGVPVELARPLAALDRDEQQTNDEELRSADCLLAVAVGLGLRRPGDKTA